MAGDALDSDGTLRKGTGGEPYRRGDGGEQHSVEMEEKVRRTSFQ